VARNKFKSSVVVREGRRIETNRVKAHTEVLLVAGATIVVSDSCVKPSPYIKPGLERLVTAQASLVGDACLTECVATGAIRKTSQVAVRRRELAGREDLASHWNTEEYEGSADD
jgi:hypothetical protein